MGITGGSGMKKNENGHRVILFRQTEKGYDVISPYQISEKVSKEVYQAVLGIVEEHGNQGNRNGAKVKKLEEEVRELKGKLASIRKAVSAV
jgi:hypothetical protein